MMSISAEKPKLTPAYASFRSFNTFFDARREDGHITTVVDRSLMSNFAGSTAGELLAALKYLGMTDDKGAPSESYEQYMLADNDGRGQLLNKILRRSYPFIFETERFDIERATSQQVIEMFRAQGISGSTLGRAMTFFLAAAKQAGVKVSPNIRAPGIPTRPPKAKPVAPTATLIELASASPITQRPTPVDVQVFEIPIPIGRKVTISIPNEFSSADWELFQTMLTAYVQHWKVQMSGSKPVAQTPIKETNDEG